ncbi:MAG TPA: hypothetical protein DDZ96_02585 [Porphyromonadaceae bacterium]|jgi:hypothetical protein|nr:hypothetical protein [Porphyromonadaceae bacterium]HBK31954.1 hypothetical protein [Porphyromonadaceae bacterium]HBL32693.1 hypothetical protein [Porphyromonadaceae bacterium]HBX21913.1 hypothetical protein [Porphyromonadaceae bacterium]HCM21451.1 hypothetical protein [Porphyromonadaceae bacterium]
MKTSSENISLTIPTNDMQFFKELVNKMGWTYETKESALQKYIASRPKDVKFSEEDILSEVRAVRYGK